MRGPNDILLLVRHPWGEARCTLQDWMKHGPGLRYLVAPAQAWDVHTGEELPMDVIPRPYRNDAESIRMILEGEVEDPWSRDVAGLREAYDLLKNL